MSKTYYGSFYGFSSSPFHITPDPSVLLLTETHMQALGAIEYGITSGKGFIVVTGEVGVGKTTVLRTVLDRLDPSKIKVIYLFNPAIATAELYATLLEELDFVPDPSSKSSNVLQNLMRALLSLNKAGTQVILAVDEAQNMPEQTLESLRIVSNLETSKSKLLQIILVGQPELEVLLNKHSLRQLAQRVAVRARIKALTLRQSFRYIRHRSQCAGRTRPLFTVPALWYIALTARGIPRSINICCDNSLINGYGHGSERISLEIARESCRSLRYGSKIGRLGTIAASLAVLTCAVFFGSPYLVRFVPASARDQVPELGLRDRSRTEAINANAVASPADAHTSWLASPRGSAVPLVTARTPAPQVESAPSPPNAPLEMQTGDGVAASNLSFASGTEALKIAGLADPIVDVRPGLSDAPLPTVPNSHEDSQTMWKWFVRRGDTIKKVCRITYGVCDEQTLRTILEYNPQIGSSRTLRKGMVIIMPDNIEPAK
jgi:general secretion pathway protein A